MSERGARVSNVNRFESMYSDTPQYNAEEDIFEGREILKENSDDGLCPHQHFQEDMPIIDVLCPKQDDHSISIRICH